MTNGIRKHVLQQLYGSLREKKVGKDTWFGYGDHRNFSKCVQINIIKKIFTAHVIYGTPYIQCNKVIYIHNEQLESVLLYLFVFVVLMMH